MSVDDLVDKHYGFGGIMEKIELPWIWRVRMLVLFRLMI